MLWFAIAAAAQASCTVFSGAQVFVDRGFEQGVTVVIDAGEIVGVGKGLRALKLSMSGGGQVASARWNESDCDYQVVSGKHLTPGLVEVDSALGLVEVDLEPASRDDDAKGDPIRAALDVSLAYNPRSTLVPIQRAMGITSAVIRPSGGLISGSGAWVQLTGQTQDEAIIASPVAMYADPGSTESRADGFLRMGEALEDARDFLINRAAWDRNARRPYAEGASRLDLQALAPVVERKIPLVVAANRAADIEALLRQAEVWGVDLVILGGAEAWLVADQLAAAQVPVIVDPLLYRPGSFDQVHASPLNAAKLDQAGVPLILSTSSSHGARRLRQAAGNAVREGLPHDRAVRAITATPALVFGQTAVGRIAVGQRADLVLWSGDPLELSSRVESVYIRGEAVPLRTRQQALFERYQELAPTSPTALDVTP